MTDMSFLAGAATRRITPPLERGPVYLAGFQPNRCATGVDLDLHARALALRSDEQSVVLVAVDLIGLGLPDIEEIRARLAQRGGEGAQLVVACTHTHSAPDTLGLWGPGPDVSGVDATYLELVKRAIIDAAIEALTFCCPVQMRHATTRLPGYIENYRNPEIVDDEIAALQFVKPDGEVVATLLNLACHPEVLDGASTLISADYAGAACAAVEAAVGGTALHISGALGGMLSPSIADRSPDGVRRMGAAYAEQALAALRDAALSDPSQLRFARSRFVIPFENPLFHQAEAAGLIRSRPHSDDTIQTECALIDLGAAQILTIPGELLPRLGFELKQALPGPCRMLAGIADDELGYILPDDEFIAPANYLEPGAQYEESMSVSARAGSHYMRAARALLEQA
jgi:hypothetical protein